MELKPLGLTGMKVSALGLGTVKIGRNQGVKYPQGFELPDDNAVRDLFAQARELGINLIDTAPAYGTSEDRVGQLLDGSNEWVIVSKVGESFIDGESRFDFSAKGTQKTIEQSLRKLKRDYIDVVLVHSDGDDMRIIQNEGALEMLDQLKQKGLIRAFGMSTKTIEGGKWVVEHCDVVMATYNISEDKELPVLQLASKLNKGVLIKKGLLSGHADMQAGGEGIGKAIRFVFEQPSVSSLIVGTINPAHLQENVRVTNAVFKVMNKNSSAKD